MPLPFVIAEFASGSFDVDWRTVTIWSPLSAGCLGLAYLAYYTGLHRGPVSVVTGAASAWLAVTVIVVVLLFGQSVSGVQVGLMVVILAGIIMLSLRAGDSLTGGTGLWWGLLAMLGLGIAIAIFTRITEAAGPMVATFVVRALSVVPSYLFMRSRGVAVLLPKDPGAWRLLFFASALDAAGYMAYNLGVDVAPVAIVAPIVAAHPVATIVLAVVLIKERPQPLQWTGVAVVVSAVVCLSTLVGG